MRDLHLDVRISYVQVSGCSKKQGYPVLAATDWVKCIDRFGFWSTFFGIDDFTEGTRVLTDFWNKYRVLYPNFEMFKIAADRNIPLSRVCPVYIHGDEGQHYKKGAVMVLQMQSLFGRGTRKHNPDMFGNEVGYQVNQKGITLTTRLLYTVMPKDPAY